MFPARNNKIVLPRGEHSIISSPVTGKKGMGKHGLILYDGCTPITDRAWASADQFCSKGSFSSGMKGSFWNSYGGDNSWDMTWTGPPAKGAGAPWGPAGKGCWGGAGAGDGGGFNSKSSTTTEDGALASKGGVVDGKGGRSTDGPFSGSKTPTALTTALNIPRVGDSRPPFHLEPRGEDANKP